MKAADVDARLAWLRDTPAEEQRRVWHAEGMKAACGQTERNGMNIEKLPPHDIASEEAVLGSILIDGAAWLKVKDWLAPHMFYRDRNRYCYEACQRAVKGGFHLNQVTVAHQLDLDGNLDVVGGPGFLSHLVAIIPTPNHAADYGRIIKECWELRQEIQRAGAALERAYEGKDAKAGLERYAKETPPWKV